MSMTRDIFDWCADTTLLEGSREGDFFKLVSAVEEGADPDYANGLPVLEAVRHGQGISIFVLESASNLDVRNGLPLVMAVAMRKKYMASRLLGCRAKSATNVFGKGMDGHLEEAMAVARATRSREMEAWLKARGAVEPRAVLSANDVEKAVLRYDVSEPKPPYAQLMLVFALTLMLAGQFGEALYKMDASFKMRLPPVAAPSPMPK
ncbi:MAG TPA: hypothetical protein DCW68_01415 [Rhodospirillaceae bacterium]|nr:MAG: hypothetical protein A2018_04380 [Alphaproteobacteria bacterium GWF2_58_20]HAU28756.1 hypothetical protein [Rhodospirillaceae bacterium]